MLGSLQVRRERELIVLEVLLMPLLTLQTSVTLSNQQRYDLLAPLSKIVAECIGKPERYVMVSVSTVALLMDGYEAPAAYADLRSIGGLSPAVNRKLSERICALLKERLGIPPDRVYLGFTSVSAENWGWNGGTFG
jgi:phenylpyruvate tautomerase PptA (4-oxalocrotonate tautomerase family)